MPTSPQFVKHLSGGKAIAIQKQIDGVVPADQLCLAGFSYPLAIALAAIISAGTGGAKEIQALHVLRHSASDAAAIVAAANLRGPH